MYETQSGILIDSPVDEHLNWFHFLAAVNLAAVSVNLWIYLWDIDLDSFGYMLIVSHLGHMLILFLDFL